MSEYPLSRAVKEEVEDGFSHLGTAKDHESKIYMAPPLSVQKKYAMIKT